jgi:hypothetical protein
MALDDHAPAVGNVPSAGREERGPRRYVRRVDQVRRQQHGVETPAERDVLDPRAYGLRSPDVRQHFRGFVDCDDPMAERDQRVGDPPGPGAEFEDRRSHSGRVMHDGGLAEIG